MQVSHECDTPTPGSLGRCAASPSRGDFTSPRVNRNVSQVTETCMIRWRDLSSKGDLGDVDESIICRGCRDLILQLSEGPTGFIFKLCRHDCVVNKMKRKQKY